MSAKVYRFYFLLWGGLYLLYKEESCETEIVLGIESD